MNIFDKRPLCLILCIGLCGFFLFSLEIAFLRIALPICAILLGIISLLLFLRKKKPYITLALISAGVFLSCILSYIYFDMYFKAYEIYDEDVEIIGVVEGVSESSSYTTRLLVNVEYIDGNNSTGYSFYAYVKKTDAKGVIEGTKVSFTATLTGFSDESKNVNIAKGINAYASDVKDLQIVEYTNGGIAGLFNRFREYITRYIISLTNKDTGAIVSALLLGERDYLPDQLRLDFRRIGISHILALSGMHLAILSLGINKVLSLFRVKKKIRVATVAVFVFLYMALTGFSVSVVRAGLMLIISSILYLLSRTKDSLTSLAVSVTIICLISPNAIFDVSLQLSALATFGIIILSEISYKFKEPKTKVQKILKYFAVTILASVFAISSTILVSTTNFGGFYILAPITTLIFSFLAEVIMYLGCVLVVIGWLIPIGWILTPFCFVMSWLSGVFSSIKFAYVSSKFDYAIILIFVYTVLFYIFTVIKLKKPIRILNLMMVLFCIITILPTVLTVTENNKETVAYCSSAKSDQVLVRSNHEICLINSSQYSKNLAYTTIEFLEAANVTYLDKYYLTHYSWNIDDEIKVLLSNMLVDNIYLPTPRNNDERTILKTLLKAVSNHRTEIILFNEYETVKIGDYNINLLYSAPYGETSMNAFSIAKRDTIYTYISSGLLETSMKSRFMNYISLSDYIILGEHGKKYKDKVYIEDCYADLEAIVIHSANVFLKQENMKYFVEKGCDIFTHPNQFIYFKKD